jgi:hypothetical protein
MVDIPMAKPCAAPADPMAVGYLPRSDDPDLFFLCAPPPEAKLHATPPDPMADGISE